MTVQVLVSTMNQTDHSLIKNMNISTDAVVVNQCGKDSVEEFYDGRNKIKWINSSTIGLSVSRNICLKNATADICLLADDDLYYVDDYESIVINAFKSNPGYSLIRFIASGIERPFKQYPKKAEEISFFSSFKISSVELAIMRKKIRGIRFDESIGAGTRFMMGEENAFLAECFRRKLKILYLPEELLKLHIGDSSWYKGMDERYFISRGAAFAAMKTKYTSLLILQFALRKYRRYKGSISLNRAIKLMHFGKDQYIQEKRKSYGRRNNRKAS